jgi:chemotaxis protein methyltransferase CheR
MTEGLSDQLLSQLSKSVADQAGLYFPQERWSDLERGIQSATLKFGCSDAESCARLLLSGPLNRKQIEILAGELTVGETYFFREKRSFEILSEQILPELVRARQGSERRLRIWSAGCCTGEEPYSIAILLDRILPDLRQWHVTILATDVNPHFLQKATEGVFSDWSFRDSPPWLKENYFKQIDKNRFEIAPRIKERVAFAYLNLAEDVYPCLTNNTNAMDLIFCRNVLMYFAAERIKRVAHNFHRSLVNAGWLLVSPTETSSGLFPQFSAVHFEGAVLYQKGEKALSGSVIPLPLLTPITSDNEEVPVLPQMTLDFIPKLSFPVPSSQPTVEPQVVEASSTTYEEALVLFEQGNYMEATEKLKGDGQPTAKSSTLLARIYANLGELAEARAWSEKAIGADKLNAELHYLRAIILQEQDAREEGVVALKRALYLDPDFVLAHFALGNLALQQNNFKEADKHFTNVLGLLADYQPDDVLSQSDGLAAGRLKEMVVSAMSMERAA